MFIKNSLIPKDSHFSSGVSHKKVKWFVQLKHFTKASRARKPDLPKHLAPLLLSYLSNALKIHLPPLERSLFSPEILYFSHKSDAFECSRPENSAASVTLTTVLLWTKAQMDFIKTFVDCKASSALCRLHYHKNEIYKSFR